MIRNAIADPKTAIMIRKPYSAHKEFFSVEVFSIRAVVVVLMPSSSNVPFVVMSSGTQALRWSEGRKLP